MVNKKRGLIFGISFLILIGFMFTVNAGSVGCPDQSGSGHDALDCFGDCCTLYPDGFCLVDSACDGGCNTYCSSCLTSSECQGSTVGCIWDSYPELYGGRCYDDTFERDYCSMDEDNDNYGLENYDFSVISSNSEYCDSGIDCDLEYSNVGDPSLCERDIRCQLTSGGASTCIPIYSPYGSDYACSNLNMEQCNAANGAEECYWFNDGCQAATYGSYSCQNHWDDPTGCAILPGCDFYSTQECADSAYNNYNYINYEITDCDDENSAINPGVLENTLARCSDGIENDCDGYIDCNDPGCSSYCTACVQNTACCGGTGYSLNGECYSDSSCTLDCSASSCIQNTACCGGTGYSLNGECYSDSSCTLDCSTTPSQDPESYWMNNGGTTTITEVTVPFGGEMNVTMILQYSGLTGAQNFVVYETRGVGETMPDMFVASAAITTSEDCPGAASGGVTGLVVAGKDCPNEIISAKFTLNQALFDTLIPEADGAFEFYFKVNNNGTLQSGILIVNVEDQAPTGPTAYWMDYQPSLIINQVDFTVGNELNVSMILQDSGLTSDQVTFTTYESDVGEGGTTTVLGGASTYTLPLEGGVCPEEGGGGITANVITGFATDPGGTTGSCPTGAIMEVLTINDQLLIESGLEPDGVYEFYFEVEEIATGTTWTSGILEISVTGTPGTGDDIAHWMNEAMTANVTNIYMNYTDEITVSMVLENAGLSSTAYFEVWESDDGEGFFWNVDDNLGGVSVASPSQSNFVSAPFVINSVTIDAAGESDDRLELYFVVNENDVWTSGILYVYYGVSPPTEEPNAFWVDSVYGNPLTTFTYDIGETNQVALVLNNSGLDADTSVIFTIKDEDSCIYGDQTITTVSGTVNSQGTALALWTIEEDDFATAENSFPCNNEGDYYEFYFEVEEATSPILNTSYNLAIIDDCNFITACFDYATEELCSADDCGIEIEISGIDCNDPNTNCECVWDNATDSCGPTYGSTYNGVKIGDCYFSEDLSTDDCEDGFISYSWTANWVWDLTNIPTSPPCDSTSVEGLDGLCYYDPTGASTQCVDGSNVIACPAQIQLSFFSTLNLVAAIILLIIVYYLIRRNATKKKTLKKKRK